MVVMIDAAIKKRLKSAGLLVVVVSFVLLLLLLGDGENVAKEEARLGPRAEAAAIERSISPITVELLSR